MRGGQLDWFPVLPARRPRNVPLKAVQSLGSHDVQYRSRFLRFEAVKGTFACCWACCNMQILVIASCPREVYLTPTLTGPSSLSVAHHSIYLQSQAHSLSDFAARYCQALLHRSVKCWTTHRTLSTLGRNRCTRMLLTSILCVTKSCSQPSSSSRLHVVSLLSKIL